MLKFNKHLAKIHAYLCADGYVIKSDKVRRKYYYIGFRNYLNLLLDNFDYHFEKYFKIKPRRMNDGRSVVQNKEITLQLLENYSFYSLNWVMPKMIKKLYTYWLQAYFDCEAWVICKKAKNRMIGIDSINKSGLESIKLYLKKFGIDSKIKPAKINIPNRNDIFRLFIFGKDNLKKFQKLIDFSHPKKKLKLQEAIDSYVDYNWNISPIGDDSAEKIRKILQTKNGFKKRGTYSICSIKKYNLIHLQEFIKKKLKIKSSIHGPRFNTLGCKYYEFTIYNKESSKKLKNFIYPQ